MIDVPVDRFDVGVPKGWPGEDLAEVLAVYLVGHKAVVFTDAAYPNRWQLGDSNNVWLHRDGDAYWVNFRYPWAPGEVGAVAVLLRKLYRLEIGWGR